MDFKTAFYASLYFLFISLYYITYPIFFLLRWLLAILIVITAPFLHLAQYVLHACVWPWHQLARFETLYIFFGVATLVGLLTGTALYYCSGFIVATLRLDKLPEYQGRTLTSYRAEKRAKEARKPRIHTPKVSAPPRPGGALKDEYAEWLSQDKGEGNKGLLSTTILEEEDSSEAGL